MGGADRPKHIFRQGDRPGMFILEVLPEGAAALTGKLRSGDRILKVGLVPNYSISAETKNTR